MVVVFPEYIMRHEWKPLQKYFDLEDVLEGCRKVIKNLAIEIKPPRKFHGHRFFKVRIGRKAKGRMIVFLVTGNMKIVPLLIRLKKDKIFGMNMSINNPQVVAQLNRNLDHVLDDLTQKRFKEFSL